MYTSLALIHLQGQFRARQYDMSRPSEKRIGRSAMWQRTTMLFSFDAVEEWLEVAFAAPLGGDEDAATATTLLVDFTSAGMFEWHARHIRNLSRMMQRLPTYQDSREDLKGKQGLLLSILARNLAAAESNHHDQLGSSQSNQQATALESTPIPSPLNPSDLVCLRRIEACVRALLTKCVEVDLQLEKLCVAIGPDAEITFTAVPQATDKTQRAHEKWLEFSDQAWSNPRHIYWTAGGFWTYSPDKLGLHSEQF